MDDMRRDDDWQKTEAKSFSIMKIRQYFGRCAPLSAQDVDGWRQALTCSCSSECTRNNRRILPA